LDTALLVVCVLIGFFFFLISAVIIIVGLVGNNKKLVNIGYGSLWLPGFLFAVMFIYYAIIATMYDREQMEDYATTYIYEKRGKQNILSLDAAGTYTCECPYYSEIPSKGTWETGGIDGSFIFYNEKGNIEEFGYPALDTQDRKVIGFPEFSGNKVLFVEKEN
jgi:hypothetical protein